MRRKVFLTLLLLSGSGCVTTRNPSSADLTEAEIALLLARANARDKAAAPTKAREQVAVATKAREQAAAAAKAQLFLQQIDAALASFDRSPRLPLNAVSLPSAKEAWLSLRNLETATATGIDYGDYAAMIRSAQSSLNRAELDVPDEGLVALLRFCLRFYVKALGHFERRQAVPYFGSDTTSQIKRLKAQGVHELQLLLEWNRGRHVLDAVRSRVVATFR